MHSANPFLRSSQRCGMLFLLICLAFPRMVSASEFPVIREPMPSFTLNKIIDYSTPTIDSKKSERKWYILDFWIMGCQPCIKSFPEVSAMVQQLKGKVEIFSIGIGGAELEKFYQPIRKKQQLQIPMAFDHLLASKWQVNSYPLIFIVDDKGILRAITYETSAAKLNTLMESDKIISARWRITNNTCPTTYHVYILSMAMAETIPPFFSDPSLQKPLESIRRAVSPI